MKKVILAFSGGLDTSFSVPYLLEKGYQVITVTVNTGGFSQEELEKIAQKSKDLGAVRHYEVDGQKEMFAKTISYIIKTNGLYQSSYPNMCADRYIIAQKTIEIAKKEKTNLVAHGSSSMGNDQVRFDVAIATIAPDFKIIAPIRDMGGNRKEEQAYLEKKGFQVSQLHKKYSVNQNIMGVTYSGSEIDKVQEPDESMFLWTQITKSKQSYLKIEFKNGNPVSLDGKKLDGYEILKKLNSIIGAYGYGRGYYTGDCVIGIKGHIAFEAPGMLTLMKAHLALEQLVLTKHQQTLGKMISEQFTDLLYSGKYYEPVMENIKAFVDSQQTAVNGIVTIKLVPGAIYPVAVNSAYALIKSEIATYAQSSSWTAADAEGFIKLFGLQGKIASQIKQKVNK